MGGNTSLFRPEAAENAVEILHGDIDLFHARADIDDAVGELGLGAAELAVAGHAGAVLPDAELVLAIAIVREIGRASCRERVCQYVSISVVAVSLNKKNNHI